MPSTRRVVQFTAPQQVDVVEEPLRPPASDEVLVRTILSAISPGTERLIYRGQAPSGAPADASIDSLSGGLDFPLTYGYAAVGRVEDVGADVPSEWVDQRVFSFQPHVSHFVASPDVLIPLPDEVRTADGVLIPNLETAVNFLMDGRPVVGERVVILGQGVVGLLTTALASRFPIQDLFTVEPIPNRRVRSEAWGADESIDPRNLETLRASLGITSLDAKEAGSELEGADLTFEVSGHPSVLNDAISITGFDGRIVIGSWYGEKEDDIDLGGRFHRSRMQIISSQVSSIGPEYRGRWSKNRRKRTVLRLLPKIEPGDLITHIFSPQEAPKVYERLSKAGSEIYQPVFKYR